MNLNERIGSLANLGDALNTINDERNYAVAKAYYENKWFTEAEINRMISGIIHNYLDYDLLSSFAEKYELPLHTTKVRSIGLIPAGNIPLVSFHDILCILLSGHQAMVKLSDKDKVLLPWVMQSLETINLELARNVTFVNRLSSFDAVIATGSNNSATLFQKYFGKYPNIIRNNKTAIAVLHGDESESELVDFSEDVFSYYGLGCRNISKIYVPKGYDFTLLGNVLNRSKKIVLHSKYKNNFDYNLAVSMLNKDHHINVASILLIESEQLHSRIASLHYQFYDDITSVSAALQSQADQIQVVVSNSSIPGIVSKPLGSAQQPALDDYADGIDTMAFLRDLN